MPVTSPDNLWSPNPTDPYNLTQDLAQMQTTVQAAITANLPVSSYNTSVPLSAGVTGTAQYNRYGNVITVHLNVSGNFPGAGTSTPITGSSALPGPRGGISATGPGVSNDRNLVIFVAGNGQIQVRNNSSLGASSFIGSVTYVI